ncbi:MAG: polysaccharide biosynthesis tyrosine autokinase [bacterium]|nr:polysaccharide biosynthesis tyrosine autokinase [bacterium]
MQDKMVEEDGKELRTYWYLLMENRFLLLSVFIAVFAFIFIFTKLSRPVYQSNSTVLIESSDKGLSFFPIREMNPRQTLINNHIEMIQSRTLIEKVVSALENDSTLDSLYLKDAKYSREKRMAIVKSGLSVIPIKDTDILRISYRDKTPFNAYYITNLIVSQYYKVNLDMTRGELSEVRHFLEEQLLKIENELKHSEENLKLYKEGNSILELSEETKMLVQMISTYEQQKKATEVELLTIASRLKALKNNLNESQKALTEGMFNTSNPFIARSLKELETLESNYAYYLSIGYDSLHPKIIEVKSRIEQIKSQVIETSRISLRETYVSSNPIEYTEGIMDEILSLQVEQKAKESMLNALSEAVSQYESKMRNVPLKEISLARLERDKKVSEELYLMLRSKYEESRVAEAGKLGAVRIIDKAVLTTSPILPKTGRNLILGFFLSLIIAIGTVLLKEYIDDSIKDIDEIEREFKIKTLGSVPLILQKADANGKADSINLKSPIVSNLPEGSPVSESYKILRTNILYISQDNPPKMMTVSSATKGEGKSTTAANLAIVLSQLNKRTLLVDADLRRPTITKLFDIAQKSRGLTHLIKENTPISECIYETSMPNLYVLPHGERTTHSTELLESAKTKVIFKELRNMFDYVIIDTSPMLSIADPTILSRISDGMLWVVQFKKAHKRDLQYASKILLNMNVNVLGFVFNNINMTSYYGRYYYYHYYYHYHTKEEGEQ